MVKKRKINVISRDSKFYEKDTSKDLKKSFSNPSSSLHRFEKSREIVRAINAAKIGKIVAQPFVAQMNIHRDTPQVIATNRHNISNIISGSCDGVIKVWDLISKKQVWEIPHAHNGFVNGISVGLSKKSFFSIGMDNCLKVWNLDTDNYYTGSSKEKGIKPIHQHTSQTTSFLSLDHHQSDNILATAGDEMLIWDTKKLVIKQKFTNNGQVEQFTHLAFNRVQTNLLAVTAKDRSIHLYDLRSGGKSISEMYFKRRTNALCWNPMNPFQFVSGSDDSYSYLIDSRKMGFGPIRNYIGHINSIQSIDFLPTGEEFVTGSYDTTIRIYNINKFTSRDCYYTKRMNKVFAVKYSLDGKFIMSGSDDQSIRIWKSNSTDLLSKPLLPQQKKIEYQKKLLDRYSQVKEVNKVSSHQNLPKPIYEMKKRIKQKELGYNRRLRNKLRFSVKKHSKDQKILEKIEKPKYKMKRTFVGGES